MRDETPRFRRDSPGLGGVGPLCTAVGMALAGALSFGLHAPMTAKPGTSEPQTT